jgi:hypothetical protein
MNRRAPYVDPYYNRTEGGCLMPLIIFAAIVLLIYIMA